MMAEAFFRFQRRSAPYLFVAPFLVTFAVFWLYPLIKSLILSTYITSGPQSQAFVGFDNFLFLLTDGNFHRAVINTAVFTLFSLLLQVPVSLGLALLLNDAAVKGRNFFRFAFFSPHLFGQVFVALLFTVIFLPQYGLLNVALHTLFGADLDRNWLGNAQLVMPSLVLTALWMNLGFNMIYFLAALQSIDRVLYEAAAVDGASAVQRFRHVTLPGIRPVLVFVLVIITIGSFQLYELPFVMLDGPGPENAGLTVVMMLYREGFEAGDLGYASAIGWTLALIVMAASLLQVVLSGALKHE